MSNMMDYLTWRGDLSFIQVPPNPVDALILSTLVYCGFEGIVAEDLSRTVSLPEAAQAFTALPDHRQRLRRKMDLGLLTAAAEAPRFQDIQLCFYRSILVPEEEIQFAAMTCLLPDGSAFLAFRGTDYSLAGLKEDLNMAFADSVPAQRAAAAYTKEFADRFSGPLRLGGHSKGGNLAVYAAAKAEPALQSRILAVYNLDGPGFTEGFLADEGYLAMVPRIQTVIPQSSIIGILLEHIGDCTVIQSSQVGPLQHEPHSWDVLGSGFVQVEQMSGSSQFVDKTVKNWIRDMDRQERSAFVEALYGLLTSGTASTLQELLEPKNIYRFFSTLNSDKATKKLLTGELTDLYKAAIAAIREK